ncbi:MAG: hypothetical protein IKE55_11045 [Kiritimatiellae bacterium]|nr:hypothetical protein [Kiritimatiellia bacterium]
MSASCDRARAALCALALAFAAGCQSYDVVQKNVFVDEDGNVVVVEYGRSSSDHVNKFVAPTTGREMEFRSKLVVRAELPDGTGFTAWQCMNFLARGTMYKTDNEKWMLLADGFSCAVYRRTDEDKTRYMEVYRGVLCDTPGERKAKKDERWKTVPSDQRTYKKPQAAPPAKK